MFILLFTLTLVFSCQTNLQKMDELVKDTEEPVVISEDVEWFYTKTVLPHIDLQAQKYLDLKGRKNT